MRHSSDDANGQFVSISEVQASSKEQQHFWCIPTTSSGETKCFPDKTFSRQNVTSDNNTNNNNYYNFLPGKTFGGTKITEITKFVLW